MTYSAAAPPRQVAEDIWMIEAPLNGVTVTIYIIRGGDTLAVVDTGYCYHPETVILPALRQLGFPPREVGFILNTHGHPDHLGGNARLQKHTTATICLHGADLRLTDGPEAHITSDTDHIMAMRALGWANEVAERETFIRDRVEACTVERVLADGDRIDLGGGVILDVVATPGHSRGCVTFYIEERNLAIAGDAVQGWGVSESVLLLFYDPAAYAASLATIEDLSVETLCLGHDVRWRGSGAGSSPVRSADAVAASLSASRQFVEALARIADSVVESGPLAERVMAVAKSMAPPFTVSFDPHGRFAATSAATIISQLGGPGTLAGGG